MAKKVKIPRPKQAQLPLFGRPSPRQEAQLDEVLERLKAYRARLIAIGNHTAERLARERGRVTSVEVLNHMYKDPHTAVLMDQVDPRWIGVVFARKPEIWEHIGYERTGSHTRPVAVWRLV